MPWRYQNIRLSTIKRIRGLHIMFSLNSIQAYDCNMFMYDSLICAVYTSIWVLSQNTHVYDMIINHDNVNHAWYSLYMILYEYILYVDVFSLWHFTYNTILYVAYIHT